MRAIIALLLLTGLAFATPPAWQGLAVAALMASLMIVAVLYVLSIAFSLNDLKFLATEEFYQLIVTVFMIAFLFSVEAFLNSLFSSIAPNLQDAGLAKIDGALQTQIAVFGDVKDFLVHIVPESTKSAYCGLSGAGFSVAPCGAFSALIPPGTLSLQALSLSIAELSSLKTLAGFAKYYSFTMLLPVGILLRTLRFTRGAGALFIGLAAALYLFLPMAVIFMDDITAAGAANPATINLGTADCDTSAFASTTGASFDYSNADTAETMFDSMLTKLDAYLYLFLVRGTLTTAVCLLSFFAAFRWISKAAGADVDLSALMRIS